MATDEGSVLQLSTRASEEYCHSMCDGSSVASEEEDASHEDAADECLRALDRSLMQRAKETKGQRLKQQQRYKGAKACLIRANATLADSMEASGLLCEREHVTREPRARKVQRKARRLAATAEMLAVQQGMGDSKAQHRRHAQRASAAARCLQAEMHDDAGISDDKQCSTSLQERASLSGLQLGASLAATAGGVTTAFSIDDPGSSDRAPRSSPLQASPSRARALGSTASGERSANAAPSYSLISNAEASAMSTSSEEFFSNSDDSSRARSPATEGGAATALSDDDHSSSSRSPSSSPGSHTALLVPPSPPLASGPPPASPPPPLDGTLSNSVKDSTITAGGAILIASTSPPRSSSESYIEATLECSVQSNSISSVCSGASASIEWTISSASGDAELNAMNASAESIAHGSCVGSLDGSPAAAEAAMTTARCVLGDVCGGSVLHESLTTSASLSATHDGSVLSEGTKACLMASQALIKRARRRHRAASTIAAAARMVHARERHVAHIAAATLLASNVRASIAHARLNARRRAAAVITAAACTNRARARFFMQRDAATCIATAARVTHACRQLTDRRTQYTAKQRAAEQRAAEQRAAEQRAAEQRAAEQRAAEQRAAAQRAAKQHAAEQRAVEQRAAEQRAAEQQAAAQREWERESQEQSEKQLFRNEESWTRANLPALLMFYSEESIQRCFEQAPPLVCGSPMRIISIYAPPAMQPSSHMDNSSTYPRVCLVAYRGTTYAESLTWGLCGSVFASVVHDLIDTMRVQEPTRAEAGHRFQLLTRFIERGDPALALELYRLQSTLANRGF